HLRAQCGGLTHRQAEVAGDDHHADLVEDRVEGFDRFGFLRTIHALLLHYGRARMRARGRLRCRIAEATRASPLMGKERAETREGSARRRLEISFPRLGCKLSGKPAAAVSDG